MAWNSLHLSSQPSVAQHHRELQLQAERKEEAAINRHSIEDNTGSNINNQRMRALQLQPNGCTAGSAHKA